MPEKLLQKRAHTRKKGDNFYETDAHYKARKLHRIKLYRILPSLLLINSVVLLAQIANYTFVL